MPLLLSQTLGCAMLSSPLLSEWLVVVNVCMVTLSVVFSVFGLHVIINW